MKKTISITLNGIIFNIEEDAYNELNNYLESIRSHYGLQESEEILADIESSIAEKFTEKINTKKKVITKTDIENIIKIMGRVEEFAEGEEVGGSADATLPTGRQEAMADKEKDFTEIDDHKPKKLYRDTDDVIIAGVCSGIGAYFGIDSVFIRIAFVLLALVQGIGILAYIILWIVMPKAETNAQKLEMRGKPVNLKKLEETIKEKSDKIRQDIKKTDKNKIIKVISFPFVILKNIFIFLRKMLGYVWPITSIMCGLTIIISAVMAILAITFVGSVLIFHVDSPYIVSDLPLTELTHLTSYYVVIVCSFFALLIPFIFTLLLGVTWLRRKNAFKLMVSSVLIVIWMMSIVIGGVAALDLVPTIKTKMDKIIETQTISRSYDFEDIYSLRIGGDGIMNVKKGDEFQFEVTGEEEVLDNLKFEVNEGELKMVQGDKRDGICFVCLEKEIIIDVIMPELESFIVFHDMEAVIEDFEQDEIRVNAGESAEVKVNLSKGVLYSYIAGTSGRVEVLGAPEKIDATLEGNGRLVALDLKSKEVMINSGLLSRVTLEGEVQKLVAEIDRSSKLYAKDLKANFAAIKTSGRGFAEIYVTDELQAIAQGSSKIYFKGEPEEISKKTAQEGEIVEIDDYEIEF